MINLKTSEKEKHKCRAWLKKMYWDEEMTLQEIGKLCGCAHATVWEYMIKFNIRRRPPIRRSIYKMKKVHIGLPRFVYDDLKGKGVNISQVVREALLERVSRRINE